MAVERTNRDIKSLIGQIAEGEIMLPEIQRGYVWRASQVAKLVESMYLGYPAGTLLLWKTDEGAETRTPAIGSGQGLPSIMPLYLLDGQQRLTSLYRVFNDHPTAQIVFNIETEAFQNQSNATLRSPKWVKVYDVVGPYADSFALQMQLRSAGLSIDGAEIGRRLKALESISQRDFHMEILNGFSYEEVTQIFVRVNSGGRPLRTTDLAMATLSARSPGFLGELEKESSRWAERGYRAVDVTFLIKAITLSLSISGKRTSSVSRLTTAGPESVAEGWERVRRGLERVVPLLCEKLLVPTTALIPSVTALHPLIVFYGRLPADAYVDPEVEKGLLYWFLAASGSNRYGGATDSALTQDVNALDSPEPVRALLANLRLEEKGFNVTGRDLSGRNIQSPYIMLSYLAAAHSGAEDWWAGGPISITAEGTDKLQYSTLHPASQLRNHRNKYSSAEINELANIVFVSQQTAKNMIGNRSPAAYIKDVQTYDLTAHAVPTDPRVLEADGFREFLVARRTLLAERISALLERFRPAFVKAGSTEVRSEGHRKSLTLTGYAAGSRTLLLAEAQTGAQHWSGRIDTAELDAALDAAASGLDSDVTVADETAPLKVDEDGVTLQVGPFKLRGTADQWRVALEDTFSDTLPAADCPEAQSPAWIGEVEEFLLADLGTQRG
ncbi:MULTISPECIES: GmrSD restriction endonuclease domain-containing protein [unclassified Streptomyces]|uniref:GmrSD restriction endonuclease domain-containing protein n=1 Tax=unclassified Streptomyces TaxID=2593676 RepID=UPI00192A0A06|nr:MULTISPECIES: DUF262 domain-containing protein [unclassified Streptomyces]